LFLVCQRRRLIFTHAHTQQQHVIIQRLRQRLCPGRSKPDTVAFALDLITQSYNSLTTRQYDQFQLYTSQICP